MIANCDLITIRTVVVTATTRSVQLLMVESGLATVCHWVGMTCHDYDIVYMYNLLSYRASLTSTDDHNLRSGHNSHCHRCDRYKSCKFSRVLDSMSCVELNPLTSLFQAVDVLSHLHQRWSRNVVYSRLGRRVMLAVNPNVLIEGMYTVARWLSDDCE